MNRVIVAFVLAQAIFIAGVLALPTLRSAHPHPWEPNAPMRPWTNIIVHHSASAAGDAAQFDRDHREKGWDGLGYDFVIGNGTDSQDGEVEVGYRWRDQQVGAHAKPEWNSRAIGICLVGNFEEEPPTAAQLASLERLCRWLCLRCSIPPENVLGHGKTDGNHTLCPGRLLDLDALRRHLREAS